MAAILSRPQCVNWTKHEKGTLITMFILTNLYMDLLLCESKQFSWCFISAIVSIMMLGLTVKENGGVMKYNW